MQLNEMFKQSRYDSGLSQQKVADRLKINKSTIQHWENGDTVPTFDKIIEYFKALGIPMYPYLMQLLYPSEISGFNPETSIEEVREGLEILTNELDDFHAKELYFILSGAHGSSPTGNIDLITAYLHLPLAQRVCIAENILSNYEMACALGMVHNTQHVLPKTETLHRCVDTARTAAMRGHNSYIEE